MPAFAIPTPVLTVLLITAFAGAGLVKNKVVKVCLATAGCVLLLGGLLGLLG
jgi:ribosomal protein S5